jgi:hypothetical protein
LAGIISRSVTGSVLMSDYLKGSEVIKILDIAVFELVGLARKGVLQPYSRFGKKICDIKIKIEQEKPFNEAKRLASLYIRIISLEDNKKKLASDTVGLKSYFFTDRDKFETRIDKIRAEITDLERRGITLETYKEGKAPLPKEYQDCVWEKFDFSPDEEGSELLVQRFLNFFYEKSEVNKHREAFRHKSPQAVPFSDVKNWGRVTLTIQNDTIFEVKYPGGFNNLSKEDAGFTPYEWELLRILAKEYGKIKPSNIDDLKMKVSRLRSALRRLFPNIKDDPIPYQKPGYKTAFTIRFGKYANTIHP